MLPLTTQDMLKKKLDARLENCSKTSPLAVQSLAEKIRSYFEGWIIEDWGVQADLSACTPFTSAVLNRVGQVPYGSTISYGEVARYLERPGAARAVGRVMACNTWPLIIPCHRVLGVKGLVGFSAPGGIQTKQALLDWERGHKEKVGNKQ